MGEEALAGDMASCLSLEEKEGAPSPAVLAYTVRARQSQGRAQGNAICHFSLWHFLGLPRKGTCSFA